MTFCSLKKKYGCNYLINGTTVLLFLFLFTGNRLSAKEIITDPRFTHDEAKAKHTTLVQVGEITEEINDTTFMAKPMSLAVDDKGNIFVYDAGHSKVFVFDKNYRFVKTFGRQGQGPGEFHGLDGGDHKLYFANNRLLACDGFNNKIIIFDTSGNLDKEIPLRPSGNFKMSFLPVVDSNWNFYVISTKKGALDVYNKEMEYLHTLLETDHYDRYLLHEPLHKTMNKRFFKMYHPDLTASLGNTRYEVLPDNRAIIYLRNSSRLFIFKEGKIEKQFDIWPKELLEWYKEKVKFNQSHGNLKYVVTPIILKLIVDKDDGRYFYVAIQKGFNTLYKYDTDGNLLEVLEAESQCRFEAKRNGLYYGFKKNRFEAKIKIFKIKDKKRG